MRALLAVGLAIAAGLVPGWSSAAEGDVVLSEELQRERAARVQLEGEVKELRSLVDGLRASVHDLQATQRRPVAAGPSGSGTQVGVEKEEARQLARAERQILEQRRAVLSPGGQLTFEPGIEYTQISRNRIQISGFSLIPALVIGTIDVAEVDREIFSGSVTSRYGLTDWLEAELMVPYIHRRDEEIFGSRDNEEFQRVTGDGIGDITAGLFTQLFYEEGSIPGTVLNLRVNAPTGEDFTEVDFDEDGRATEIPVGSGFWGVAVGTTFVKTFDPAVLFGTLNYYYNMEEDKGARFGTIDPGDTVEWTAGMAFALNERLALSMSFQQRITGRTEQNGEELLRSDANAATLFLGGSYTLSRMSAVTFNVGVGITDDAPDLVLELRMPLRMPFRGPVFKTPRLWGREDKVARLPDGRTLLMGTASN